MSPTSSSSSSPHRRPLHFNAAAAAITASSAVTAAAAPPSRGPPSSSSSDLVRRFHQRILPGYAPTALVGLPSVAAAIGVGAVHLKHEADRCGLPAFKILGASWGVHRAVTARLGLPPDASVDVVKQALSAASSGLTLYAATDGNHGRAVARMALLLGITAEIHVPCCMREDTRDLIRSEGARVVLSKGDYDTAVQEAFAASQHSNGLCIQDCSFGDYTKVPQWIVEGYETMLHEVDEQLDGKSPDLIIVPVGVGSFAQSVVTHYKTPGSPSFPRILSVEPDTAACLWKRLARGEERCVRSAPTVMAGLDCLTVSEQAWPVLQRGIDASATVSDFEAHQACETLQELGVGVGPCGAAALAALRRLTPEDKASLGLDDNSVVVLLSTEGPRSYDVPHDVSAANDPVALTQALVRIDSANPALGSEPGPGETEIAKFICSWFEHRDIDAHWLEPAPGRPSVVGVVRGRGGGKRLLLNGHTDTVTLVGYDDDALDPRIEDGKLYGRGSADMKSGLAAQMVAAANAKRLGLAGDVIVTAVADEEFESLGTVNVLEAGWRADAAVVCECTDMAVTRAHKGFAWAEIDVHGAAAHGSRPDLGRDAIAKAGYVLVALDRYAEELGRRPAADPVVGPPSAHASLIRGGEEVSSYPAKCTITLERRTVAGEGPDAVERELREMLEQVAAETPGGLRYDLRITFHRPPFHMDEDAPLTQLVRKHTENVTRGEPQVVGAPYWTDSALLLDAGIPTILFGPRGEGFHAKEEFVYVDSIIQTTHILTQIAQEFCA
ncbi:acetylornithine deacetylase [Cordyceps fumosorosea ARSEF 2679]|uniref:Acetylornithine deacetylase n=1 Tax=Cordyceps fumosorosea (strain ARSEF 2679) TaxID=1081104 RepID=A0A168AT41_CORFA|nr:acetylornithine deacetylase [Cordyceps fumosorosea ARSEF 2679]OAA69158.1 acetylornithine deacetylase [Cordyceps fumosorosea ARSEF 2679]